ncbi:MAG: hypothetical protein ACLU4N_25645 [Butyricimonas faecihominis]
MARGWKDDHLFLGGYVPLPNFPLVDQSIEYLTIMVTSSTHVRGNDITNMDGFATLESVKGDD